MATAAAAVKVGDLAAKRTDAHIQSDRSRTRTDGADGADGVTITNAIKYRVSRT